MNARARKQLLALGALVAVIAVIVALQSDDTPAERAAQPSNQSGRGRSGGPVEAPVVDLRLERLSADRGELGDSERNPFRFRPAPPPPAPRVEARPAPRPETFAPPPAPAGPPPPPPIPLKFYGLAETQGTRVAYFSDARGNVILGKEGDIIEGRYRVLRIGPDSAELANLNGTGRQTIRLSGQ